METTSSKLSQGKQSRSMRRFFLYGYGFDILPCNQKKTHCIQIKLVISTAPQKEPRQIKTWKKVEFDFRSTQKRLCQSLLLFQMCYTRKRAQNCINTRIKMNFSRSLNNCRQDWACFLLATDLWCTSTVETKKEELLFRLISRLHNCNLEVLQFVGQSRGSIGYKSKSYTELWLLVKISHTKDHNPKKWSAYIIRTML